MGNRDHWLAEQNLTRLLDRLGWEDDAENCRLLANILMSEVDKFAQYCERLDGFDNYIARVDTLVERLRGKANSQQEAAKPLFQMTLENLSQIKSSLLSTRNLMSHGRDKRNQS